MSAYQAPLFLTELLKAKSPSGAEAQAQAVYDRFVKPHAAAYANDALGNRLASLNLPGAPTLMMAGHMDELGLMIIFVNKDGFLYFDTVGGHDLSIISGRRVIIQTANGPVKGVTGKRAIHLMDDEDRKKVPKKHEIWIDIGAKTKAEALTRVAIDRMRSIGVFVKGEGTTASLTDVSISSTESDGATGFSGKAIEVQAGAAVTGTRVAIRASREGGIIVFGPVSRASFEDIWYAPN